MAIHQAGDVIQSDVPLHLQVQFKWFTEQCRNHLNDMRQSIQSETLAMAGQKSELVRHIKRRLQKGTVSLINFVHF